MSLDVTAELRRLRDHLRKNVQACRDYLRQLEEWERTEPLPWVPRRMREVRAEEKKHRTWARAIDAALASDRCPSTP